MLDVRKSSLISQVLLVYPNQKKVHPQSERSITMLQMVHGEKLVYFDAKFSVNASPICRSTVVEALEEPALLQHILEDIFPALSLNAITNLMHLLC